MHKLQRCYLTGKDLDQFNPEEAVIVERTNFLRAVLKSSFWLDSQWKAEISLAILKTYERIDCCSKESLDAECNVLCEDNGVNKWFEVMGTCQHAFRQVK